MIKMNLIFLILILLKRIFILSRGLQQNSRFRFTTFNSIIFILYSNKMKILFTSYEALAILRGGPKTQLLQTKRIRKTWCKVDLFDMWESFNPAKYDLVHLFAANISTHSIARNLFPLKLPIVTSPIFFTQHSSLFIKSIIKSENIIKSIRPGFYTDYGITKQICDWSKHLLPNTIAEAKLISGGLGQSKNKITVVPNGVSERFLKSSKTF